MTAERTVCTLEVQSGTGERTRRTLSLEKVPETLAGVTDLLKQYDLRLQCNAFDLTVHSEEESQQKPTKLTTDKDVVKYFKSHNYPSYVFTAIVSECTTLVGNSMLIDDSLVVLSIQHPCGAAPTEKRFIPPRRDVLNALTLAVEGTAPKHLSSTTRLELLLIDTDGQQTKVVDSEDKANLYIRACMAERKVCRLTYKVVDESLVSEAAKPMVPVGYRPGNDTGAKPGAVANDEIPGFMSPTNENVSIDNTAEADVDKGVEGALTPSPGVVGESEETQCIIEPKESIQEKCQTPVGSQSNVSTCGTALAAPEGTEDRAKDAPSDVVAVTTCEDAAPIAMEMDNASYKPETSIQNESSCCVELFPQPQKAPAKALHIPSPPKKLEGVKPSCLPQKAPVDWAKNGYGHANESKETELNHTDTPSVPCLCTVKESIIVGESPERNVTLLGSLVELSLDEANLTYVGERIREEQLHQSHRELKKFEQNVLVLPQICNEDVPDEVVFAINCAHENSQVVSFPFTWSKTAVNILATLQKACLEALKLSEDKPVVICDKRYVPLCSEEQIASLFRFALRSGSSCIDVVATEGHPYTNGLPLQCHFMWGTQHIVQSLVVSAENALEDMRTALVRECGLTNKTAGELIFRLSDKEACLDMELREGSAYEQLKKVVDPAKVLEVTVLDRRRTSPVAFLVRKLSDATAKFVNEVELVHGKHFEVHEVVSILERSLGFLCPSKGDAAKRYIGSIIDKVRPLNMLRAKQLEEIVTEQAKFYNETLVLLALNSSCGGTLLIASRRPFEILTRFFRRLYKSINIAERTDDGIPFSSISRQLACAGFRDAAGLLCRDNSVPLVVSEMDFTEMLWRLYMEDAGLVCRVAVASRLSGISTIQSRRVMAKEEREVLIKNCRRELLHAFDGIRADDIVKFLKQHRTEHNPHHECLLGIVSTLLANHPNRLSSQWLVDRFAGKVEGELDVMLRDFNDSRTSVPVLYQLSWDILRPQLHHLSLFPESQAASAFAYWALFAVQLLCVNRNLEFPPVALVDLNEFTYAVDEHVPAVAAMGQAEGTAATSGLPVHTPRGGKRKIKYKYNYLCSDLRRENKRQQIN
uniref:Metal-binding domain-containing protein n=1 Tax=Trypanosoma vivax (strain Y486) TaxID=1055687 RepID=G0TR06_TRYVY|nr:conserved hypothetical protein [Trypanosoma vivax Y486]